MSGRCFVSENTHRRISPLLQSDLLVYNDEREGVGWLMCQRLAVKSSHLSVPLRVCSIIMLPCPRHQRPALLRGVVSSAVVSLEIIYHKGYRCIVSGCLCASWFLCVVHLFLQSNSVFYPLLSLSLLCPSSSTIYADCFLRLLSFILCYSSLISLLLYSLFHLQTRARRFATIPQSWQASGWRRSACSCGQTATKAWAIGTTSSSSRSASSSSRPARCQPG